MPDGDAFCYSRLYNMLMKARVDTFDYYEWPKSLLFTGRVMFQVLFTQRSLCNIITTFKASYYMTEQLLFSLSPFHSTRFSSVHHDLCSPYSRSPNPSPCRGFSALCKPCQACSSLAQVPPMFDFAGVRG